MLPMDYPPGRYLNTRRSLDSVEVALGAEETSILLRSFPKAYDIQFKDVLLLWLKQSPNGLDLSGCGFKSSTLLENMTAIADDVVDLSRTVGDFAVFSSLILRQEQSNDLGAALVSFRDQLRRVPNSGRDMRCSIVLVRFGTRSAKSSI